MARKKTLIDKKAKKLAAGKCHFCPVDDYSLLDVHRITEGADGGKYTEFNTIVACVGCHRRIHSGGIVIDRKYFGTGGKWVVHYWRDGQEFWN